MENIINLTPHDVNIVNDDGETITIITIEHSNEQARVACTEEQIGVLGTDGIPLFRQVYGKIEGLPEPSADAYYIVSAMIVAAAEAEGRSTSDLLTPAGQIRNEQGQVVGCRGLAVH